MHGWPQHTTCTFVHFWSLTACHTMISRSMRSWYSLYASALITLMATWACGVSMMQHGPHGVARGGYRAVLPCQLLCSHQVKCTKVRHPCITCAVCPSNQPSSSHPRGLLHSPQHHRKEARPKWLVKVDVEPVGRLGLIAHTSIMHGMLLWVGWPCTSCASYLALATTPLPAADLIGPCRGSAHALPAPSRG